MFFVCQELFLFSCFAYPLTFRSVSSDSLYRISHRPALVKIFFIIFRLSSAAGKSSLLSSGRSASASPVSQCFRCSSVISDRCYLITAGGNCQCFFSFLFISDNSCNSDFFRVLIPPNNPSSGLCSALRYFRFPGANSNYGNRTYRCLISYGIISVNPRRKST